MPATNNLFGDIERFFLSCSFQAHHLGIPPGGVGSGEGIALLEALDVKFLIFFSAPDFAEPTAVPRTRLREHLWRRAGEQRPPAIGGRARPRHVERAREPHDGRASDEAKKSDVEGATGNLADVRTTDSLKSLTVASIERLDTRSMKVQRALRSAHVAVD